MALTALVVPGGSLVSQASHCLYGEFEAHLVVGSPLPQGYQANEYLHVVFDGEAPGPLGPATQNLDAMIVDLQCTAGPWWWSHAACEDTQLGLVQGGLTPSLCRVRLAFYNPFWEKEGSTDCAKDVGWGQLPLGTRYVVASLCDGLPTAGIDGAKPYSARVTVHVTF